MIKDNKFWDTIEETISEKDTEYIVLDLYHRLKTYVLLTDDLKEVPVDACVFNSIFLKCQNVVREEFGVNFIPYEIELTAIIDAVPEKGIMHAVVELLSYLRTHDNPLTKYCIMGVLKGLQEVIHNDSDLKYLRRAENFVNALILVDA